MNQQSKHRREFWLLVEKTIREVFRQGELSSDDKRYLLELRAEVGDLDDDEREIFFHSEPLYVAADITGTRAEELDTEFEDKYKSVVMQTPWSGNER